MVLLYYSKRQWSVSAVDKKEINKSIGMRIKQQRNGIIVL
nr:MAG TPA: hypothetical protein [Caudoviricetes sp.]